MLGPVELVDDAGDMVELSGAKMRGLLAVLAVEAGRTVTPQRLIDVLWGEQEVHGPNVVQGVVSKLRKAAAADARSLVVTRPAGYELAVAREQIDLHRFEQLVDRASASPPAQAGSAPAALASTPRAQSVQRPQQVPTPSETLRSSRVRAPRSAAARISRSVTALQTQTYMARRAGNRRADHPSATIWQTQIITIYRRIPPD